MINVIILSIDLDNTLLETTTYLEKLVENLIDKGTLLGWTILKAIVIFIAGRFLISLLNKVIRRILDKRNIDPSIKTFTKSLVNVVLTVMLIVSVIGVLGIQTTSFAALIASAGVTIGLALSGNLSNFAGGIIILLFKPFRVGDYIETSSIGGTVKEIQIFHTIINTSDNRVIYAPNGSLSSGVVTNYNVMPTRRVEWIVGIEYGEDYEKVKDILYKIIANDTRVLSNPLPFIALKQLDASSVNIVVRAWVKREDYWGVYFEMNKHIYETFNKEGISFPFPQLTIHKVPPGLPEGEELK
ncbi:MAG: mechanosensitive ion channel [Tannerellaceae bacterium]|nr:mechanosensitive ion channel [Tannerellaceae bacterium]